MSRRGIEVPPRNASMPVRVPASGKKGSGVLSPRHTAAQDSLYQDWIDEATSLELSFDDGTAIQGLLRQYDTYGLQVEVDGVVMLVYKQALRWIKPTASAPRQ